MNITIEGLSSCRADVGRKRAKVQLWTSPANLSRYKNPRIHLYNSSSLSRFKQRLNRSTQSNIQAVSFLFRQHLQTVDSEPPNTFNRTEFQAERFVIEINLISNSMNPPRLFPRRPHVVLCVWQTVYRGRNLYRTNLIIKKSIWKLSVLLVTRGWPAAGASADTVWATLHCIQFSYVCSCL